MEEVRYNLSCCVSVMPAAVISHRIMLDGAVALY